MLQNSAPGGTERGPLRRFLVYVLTGLSLALLVGGCTASVGLLASPALLAGAPRATINTPAPAPTGAWPTPGGNILPLEPGSLQAQGADPSPRTLPAAGAAAAPSLAFALPEPAFEISPEVGPAGTQINIVGQGWAPNDRIILRLQDPANPYQRAAEFALTNSDAAGNFQANFTLPTSQPWATTPAILIWAASQNTGIQAAQPEPFVVLSAPLQVSSAAQPQQAGTGTPTATATGTPTSTPSATPGGSPTAMPSGTATVTATAVASATLSPTPTPSPTQALVTPTSTVVGAFESPLATPTPLPTFTPLPTQEVAPGTLPRAGGDVLSTAYVRTAEGQLRAGPDARWDLLARLPQGAALGIMGQNAARNWLLVTTAQGATGWVLRLQTDFAGTAAVTRP